MPNTHAHPAPKLSLLVHEINNDGNVKMIKFYKLKHKNSLQFPFLHLTSFSSSLTSSSINATTKDKNNNNDYDHIDLPNSPDIIGKNGLGEKWDQYVNGDVTHLAGIMGALGNNG